MPKSLSKTMPTFDKNSEKFELFEDLFQTSLKIHNQLTEEDRINYFQSLIRRDALQTFKNINGPTRKNLGETLAVFRKNYVKPQSMATAKHKLQKLVFQPANHKLVDFLDELQKLARTHSELLPTPSSIQNAIFIQTRLEIASSAFHVKNTDFSPFLNFFKVFLLNLGFRKYPRDC